MEWIVAAAIKTKSGMICSVEKPGRHHNIIHDMAYSGMDIPIKGCQGFMTNEGRFVDRTEAKKIAIESGQLDKSQGMLVELYSECLW